MKECCKNCKYSILDIAIDGLITCELDWKTKDCDMTPCEAYNDKPSYRWKDPYEDS